MAGDEDEIISQLLQTRRELRVGFSTIDTMLGGLKTMLGRLDAR